MFYSTELLSKTGALAKEWLAANQEKKLSKVQILQHNLQDSVDTIMQQNQAPLALRLFGHLLLGCVRIYSRKARYLLDDCNEALIKLKMVGCVLCPASASASAFASAASASRSS